MATVSIDRPDLFGANATVGIYPAAAQLAGQAPSGPVLATGTTDSSGRLSVTSTSIPSYTALVAYGNGRYCQCRSTLDRSSTGVASGIGDLRAGGLVVENATATTGEFVTGQKISGPGIPADTTIVQALGPELTLSKPATGTVSEASLLAESGLVWTAKLAQRAVKVTGALAVTYRMPTVLGSAGRPLAMPDDTAVDPGSALAVQALVDQAAHSGGTYSVGNYAPPVVDVGAFSTVHREVDENQPLIKVAVTDPQFALDTALGYNLVPLPPDTIPQGDSDSTATLYQRGVTRGPGWHDVYWEFVGLQQPTPEQVADGCTFQCRRIARRVNARQSDVQQVDLIGSIGATYDDPTSDPYAIPDQRNGAYQYNFVGASAVGMNPPFILHCITPQDLRRGYSNRPVGLLTGDCRKGVKYPGSQHRFDGTLDTYPFQELDRFRVAAGTPVPAGLTPMEEFLFRSARDGAGIVPVDKTGNVCMAVRATSDCAPLFVVNSPIDGRDWSNLVISNLALWGALQMVVAGSRNELYPRSNNKVSTGIGALASWELWLDPSQLTGFSDGASVARQTDYSGRGRDAFTYGVAPVYKASVINGRPVLRFNGTTQGQEFAPVDLTNFTAFVVQKTSGTAPILAAPSGASQLLAVADGVYGFADDSGTYADAASSATGVARSSFSIVEVVRSGSTVSWFENGTARGTGTVAPTGAGPRMSQVMNVPSAVAWGAGDLGDVLIASTALSSGVRSSVRAALGTKYGITVV